MVAATQALPQARTDETWADWATGGPEPAELIDRQELLRRLADQGVKANTSDLQFWEYSAVLPRPQRKWDPAARARRAYYPDWLVLLVMGLREFQASGIGLADTGPALRRAVAQAAFAYHEKINSSQDADFGDLLQRALLSERFWWQVAPAVRALHETYVRWTENRAELLRIIVDYVAEDDRPGDVPRMGFVSASRPSTDSVSGTHSE